MELKEIALFDVGNFYGENGLLNFFQAGNRPVIEYSEGGTSSYLYPK
jgi:hypothetical protein